MTWIPGNYDVLLLGFRLTASSRFSIPVASSWRFVDIYSRHWHPGTIQSEIRALINATPTKIRLDISRVAEIFRSVAENDNWRTATHVFAVHATLTGSRCKVTLTARKIRDVLIVCQLCFGSRFLSEWWVTTDCSAAGDLALSAYCFYFSESAESVY